MLDKYDVGIISPLYTCFRIKNSSINRYLSWYFKTSKWYRYIYLNGDNGARGDRVSIKNVVFFDLPISIPQDLTECIEISRLLDLVQVKLTTLKEKINTLKKYKKGLQQRLFLRQNSLEYLRLKEIVKFMPKSKLSAGLSISNGKYPFFLSGDKTGKINDFLYEGIYVIANDGGEAGFRTTQNKFAYSDHCICFKAQTDYVTKNVYEYLDLIKAQITYIGFTGSGLKNIDRNYFENIKIPKIVLQPIHAFNLFNSLIERLNLKLTNLKLMKKYLLRNLFI